MALIELTATPDASNQNPYSDDVKQIFEALLRALQAGNGSAAEVAFAQLKRSFQKGQRPASRKKRRKVVQKRPKTPPTLVNNTPA
ncbi:hypothetical protein [Schlesneria sp.]|uniref:hypothetical protein n=1 Tax=Schlesneria sp. TaxID=2762018 RepID=UPI002EDE5331